MVNEKLSLLFKVQEIDTKIDAAYSEIEDRKKTMEEYAEKLRLMKETVENKKKEIAKINVDKKEKELTVSSMDGEIGKHSRELNAVKSNVAYKALLAEINVAKEKKSVVEDGILELMMQEETASQEFKNLTQNLLAFEKEAQVKKDVLDTEIKGFELIIENLGKDKGNIISGLPRNIADIYENIRKKKMGVAVVELIGHICGGCHKNLPLRVVDEVRKGTEIIVCEYCQRILYRKE